MNNESRKMWEEFITDYTKVLTRHSHGRIEENHKIFSGWDLNWLPPKCESHAFLLC